MRLRIEKRGVILRDATMKTDGPRWEHNLGTVNIFLNYWKGTIPRKGLELYNKISNTDSLTSETERQRHYKLAKQCRFILVRIVVTLCRYIKTDFRVETLSTKFGRKT